MSYVFLGYMFFLTYLPITIPKIKRLSVFIEEKFDIESKMYMQK